MTATNVRNTATYAEAQHYIKAFLLKGDGEFRGEGVQLFIIFVFTFHCL